MAPPTGFEPATPSGHRFQVGFLTTRTDGICNWRRRRDSNADSLATGHLSRVVRYHYSTPTYFACGPHAKIKMVGAVGVGPTTSALSAHCSTTELRPSMYGENYSPCFQK